MKVSFAGAALHWLGVSKESGANTEEERRWRECMSTRFGRFAKLGNLRMPVEPDDVRLSGRNISEVGAREQLILDVTTAVRLV